VWGPGWGLRRRCAFPQATTLQSDAQKHSMAGMGVLIFRLLATIRSVTRALREGYISLLVGIAVTVAGWFVSKGLTTPPDPRSILAEWFPEIVIGFLILAFLIFVKTRVEFRKDQYDVGVALQYSDKFDLMRAIRVDAAESLAEYKGQLHKIKKLKQELESIDDVLDFLDDLGFLVLGDQISNRVAHHFFYYWIRGYWEASKSYIWAWQQFPGEELRWNYIERLFAITDDVESRLSRRRRIRLFLLSLVGQKQPLQAVAQEENVEEEQDEGTIFLQEEMDLLKPTKKREKAMALEQAKSLATLTVSRHDRSGQRFHRPGSHAKSNERDRTL
jgi:hypothetical protein